MTLRGQRGSDRGRTEQWKAEDLATDVREQGETEFIVRNWSNVNNSSIPRIL